MMIRFFLLIAMIAMVPVKAYAQDEWPPVQNDETESPASAAPAEPAEEIVEQPIITANADSNTGEVRWEPTTAVEEVRYLKWPETDKPFSEKITITQSTSQILRFDRPLARVAVSNVDTCDITTLGAQEVLIYCRQSGRINLLVWDMDYQVAIFDVQSTVDTKKIREILENIDPKGIFRIVAYKDTFSVYGSASTNEKVKKIEEAAKNFNDKALSYVKVEKPKQILLEVRFAEIDRRANKDYGLDAEAISRFIVARSFTGETSGGGLDALTFTPRSSVRAVETLDDPDPAFANEFFSYTTNRFRVQSFLRWLAQKNILKLTARPNLIALDGEQANFVVGGESPYITATQTSVNVAFKEFGTKLAFTPAVLDDDMIRLDMRVEVSELDFSSTISLQGTTVPTVIKTTHETVAELKDNETLVVGGLVNQRINRVEKKVPFLGSIPLLDKLFSRLEFERKDIELLIVVTPHIIEPFPNPVKKNLFPPADVLDATSVYVPAYPDLQADIINRMMIQGERYHDFDNFALHRAQEIEAEFVRVKERDNVMDHALRRMAGVRWREEREPFPQIEEPPQGPIAGSTAASDDSFGTQTGATPVLPALN